MSGEEKLNDRKSEASCEDAPSEGEIFRRIQLEFPGALHRAYRAYSNCVLADFPTDAKEFVSAQAACRAALTHVMLLLRLAEQLSKIERTGSSEEGGDLDALIAEARAALA